MTGRARRLGKAPTLSELYLAFRQAKTALYYERRGVGLVQLAHFEADLASNLKRLQATLHDQPWFDGLDIGKMWVVPKKLVGSPTPSDDVVRVGPPSAVTPRILEVQARLSPSPEFATVEVLYLRNWGPGLEELVSSKSVGYRLDLRDGALDPYRRWIFQYWPKQYQEFRSTALEAAKAQLSLGREVTIVSADLASFYDTVDPTFLVSDDILAPLAARSDVSVPSFVRATKSLLRAYKRFRGQASSVLGLPVRTGVPIGALTSRVVANLALASLDAYIKKQSDVVHYRRYVDDIVVVKSASGGETVEEVLRSILPIVASTDGELPLDSDLLRRPGSEFYLQTRKSRVHRLSGRAGADFIKGIQSDFDRIVSRSKAFVDIAALKDKTAVNFLRGRADEGAPLRVLRDVDRSKLERFALDTNLRTLERASSMVVPGEVSSLVRSTLKVANRAMTVEDNWVEDLSATLRLLRLALVTHDWKSCREINRRMEAVFGDVGRLQVGITELRHRGRPLPHGRKRAWTRLRDYLHVLRLEGCAAALRFDSGMPKLAKGFPNGISDGTGKKTPKGLLRLARQLAAADLRSFDREDDASTGCRNSGSFSGALDSELAGFSELEARFTDIRKYVGQLDADNPWRMAPATLFLCTRPPSYFDVAQKLLAKVEAHGLSNKKLQDVLDIVNAIRGTNYCNPVARSLPGNIVELHGDPDVPPDAASSGVRLVLGNLSVSNKQYTAAARGTPELTIDRLVRLHRVLSRAASAARGARSHTNRPTLLVLPELSVPRRWLRPVATHIVRHGGFGAVLGLEYRREFDTVFNQAFAILPGPFRSVATLSWTKRRPAPHEAEELNAMGLQFPASPASRRRIIVQTDWGRFSVLICSELLETVRVSDLFGRANMVLCPAWNMDTASYDHLIQSVGFQLHAVVGIANNGVFSDCRAWAPYKERWKRDLCRLIERNVDDIVYVDVPMQQLRSFQKGEMAVQKSSKSKRGHHEVSDAEWRPMPPGLAEAIEDFESEMATVGFTP